jgi:hypothetical protein
MRYKNVDGVRIPYTAQEEIDRDVEEAEAEAQRPMMVWKRKMQRTDNGMPRYLEDLITDKFDGNAGTNLQVRYDDKVALRVTKPE